MNHKTILLTGGAGYIGSHVLLELAKKGNYNLIVFDNFKNGNVRAIDRVEEATNTEIEVFEGELLDERVLDKVFKSNQIDAVIHFAALIEAGVSVKNPLSFYKNNVSGTIALLEKMTSYDVRNIIFSSTAAIYGTPKGGVADEQSPPLYENPYGESKYFAEQIMRSLSNEHTEDQYKLNSVILRYFNATGANPELIIGQDYPNPTHLMTVAIEAALGIREKLTVFGNDYNTPDGTCIRDYIHVEDLARAHVKALQYVFENTGSELFNLGTGKGTSNLEVIKMLTEIHGEFPYDFGERRAGDPDMFTADPSKANNILNWKAEHSVKDALLHAYNWKKKYPDGYKQL